jgi:hypothetical protein
VTTFEDAASSRPGPPARLSAPGPDFRPEAPAHPVAEGYRNAGAAPSVLSRLRGPGPGKRHNARTIAALTGNPGCTRRGVLDAAGVDKPRLAQHIGFPGNFGQSRFALARGNAFEAMLKADGCALLLETLGFAGVTASYDDLGEDADDTLTARHARTRDLFAAGAGPRTEDPHADARAQAGATDRHAKTTTNAGTNAPHADARAQAGASAPHADARAHVATNAQHTAHAEAQDGPVAEPPAAARDVRAALIDHPLLTLGVAGQTVFLEPDLIAFQVEGRLQVVEIKSFAIVDGQADSAKVSAAAVQAAVYVLALRRLLAELGHDEQLVHHEVVLVCPENFSLRPTAVVLDVRKQLSTLRRQLTRLASVADIIAALPPALSFDLVQPPAALVDALAQVEARYAPECLSACELAAYCRHEAAGTTAALGRQVRDALGGVATIEEVLALAAGTRTPNEQQAEAAMLLQAAARLRAEAL